MVPSQRGTKVTEDGGEAGTRNKVVIQDYTEQLKLHVAISVGRVLPFSANEGGKRYINQTISLRSSSLRDTRHRGRWGQA